MQTASRGAMPRMPCPPTTWRTCVTMAYPEPIRGCICNNLMLGDCSPETKLTACQPGKSPPAQRWHASRKSSVSPNGVGYRPGNEAPPRRRPEKTMSEQVSRHVSIATEQVENTLDDAPHSIPVYLAAWEALAAGKSKLSPQGQSLPERASHSPENDMLTRKPSCRGDLP